MLSSEFQWTDEDGEHFRFLAASFDVRAAKNFIRSAPREVHEMEISGVSGLVGKPPTKSADGKTETSSAMGVYVNWEKAQSDEVELSVPVILCEVNGDLMPIDGWHRIAKAKVTGKTKIPCVVLTGEESRAVSDIPKRASTRYGAQPKKRKK